MCFHRSKCQFWSQNWIMHHNKISAAIKITLFWLTKIEMIMSQQRCKIQLCVLIGEWKLKVGIFQRSQKDRKFMINQFKLLLKQFVPFWCIKIQWKINQLYWSNKDRVLLRDLLKEMDHHQMYPYSVENRFFLRMFLLKNYI